MSRKKCISGPPNRNSGSGARVQSSMRIALALVPLAVAAAQPPDPSEIIRRSLTANEQNWAAARNYTFLQRTEERRVDSAGRVKSKNIKTYDITLLEGSPYLRLVEREDRPLPAAEERREQEKLQKSIADRQKETPAQRQRRIAEYEKRRDRQRQDMRQVGEAFNFRIVGTDRLDGHDVWVLDATPRRGYKPNSSDTKVLPHVKGKLWIDQHTFHWVRVEAEVTDPVTWGLFLVRLDPGARIRIDETLVNHEVWLPRQISISASARIGLFKKLRVEEDTTYRNYRKFQTDSRMIASQ